MKTAKDGEMRTQHFRDLLVWQKSMRLARDVYTLTATLPKSEVFGLQSQMRRAAVSVPSNIAEGHGRASDPYLRAFLAIARGSLYELETQLKLCIDLQLLQTDATEPLLASCFEITKMLNGLVKTLKPKEANKTGL